MKHKVKSIITNGLPYGITFFLLSIILCKIFNFDLQKYWWMSALIGVAALLANGIIYSRFSKPVKKLQTILIELDGAEKVLVQAPANHLIEDRLIPGKLFLTDERLLFKTYAIHDNHSKIYAWDFHQLKPEGFYRSIQNAGGEFLLKTKDDVSLMFEVDNLRLWKNCFRNT